MLLNFALVLANNFELLYYQHQLTGAEIVVTNKLLQEPIKVFSYNDNMKLGKLNYYMKKYLTAKIYFSQAIRFSKNVNERADGYYWLGRACLMNNDVANANLYLSKALNSNPNIEKEALFFYGIALYLNGNYQDGLNCLLNYENQLGDKLLHNELWLLIGACALGKNDYELALRYLNQNNWQNEQGWQTKVNYLLGLTYYLQNDINNSINKFREVIADTNLQLKQSAHLILGKIYFDQGEINKATNEFEAILKDTINFYDDYAYLYSAIGALSNNQTKKALNYLDSLINKYPSSQLVELAYFYKARSYQQNKKWRQAVREYKRFLALYPNSILKERVMHNLAKSLMISENYHEASLILEDFLRDFPNSQYRQEINYNLVQCYYQLNQDNKVQIYGEKFINDFPSSELISDIHYKLAEIGIKKNDYQYAEKHLTKITDGFLYPYALKKLGDINYILNNHRLAIDYYNLAEQFAIDSLIDEIRLNREKIFLQQGVYPSNLAMLKSFLEKYPGSRKQTLVQYEIGVEYWRQNDPVSAINELNKIKEISADTYYVALAETIKANIYWTLDKIDSAIGCYQQIINNYPTVDFLPKIFYNIALLYLMTQQYDSALIHLNKLISEFPQNQESELAYLQLVKIYRHFKKISTAIDLLKSFIIRYPKSPNLNIVYLDLADLYKEIGEYENAEKTIKTALDKIGKTADFYYKLAEINTLQNKLTAAITNFFEAYKFYLQEKKRDYAGLALFQAGKCNLDLKNYKQAKELFERCINETEDERLRIQCQEQLRQIPIEH